MCSIRKDVIFSIATIIMLINIILELYFEDEFFETSTKVTVWA